MVNKGFPKFGSAQSGSTVSALKNYNLPDFVLKMVAKECGSDLLEKGRVDDRLQSMNDEALAMLHRIFVECDEGSDKYSNMRFYAYISSMYHKCEILINEPVPGALGKNHKVPVAVKNNGMYVAVAFNKASGNAINRREAAKFYRTADDIKAGDHGTQLTEAIYGTSVGIGDEGMTELQELSRARKNDAENRLTLMIAGFENKIYSITKC